MSGANNNLPENNQRQALRDFLSLYTLTQEDNIPKNGSWDELRAKIHNGAAVLPALFGDGSQAGGLIAHVLIGDSKKNPYDNLHRVLTELNIDSRTSSAHQNHFHITLQAPDLVPIAKNLLAQDTTATETPALPSEALRLAAQELLNEVQPEFEFAKGVITMFVMDMPDVPPRYAPVIVSQASQVAGRGTTTARMIGVCHLIDASPDMRYTAVNVFDPLGSVSDYFKQIERRNVGIEGKVTLLQGPKHGTLDMGATSGGYLPDLSYLGRDSASFLVEIGGYKVKVVYSFKVLDSVAPGSEEYDPYEDKKNCPKGEHWKISFNPDDPSAGTYPSDFLFQLTSPMARLNDVRVDIADLAREALGQSTQGGITLDDNAAGHGWFVDSTPGENEEFLPTSNPNVWVARPGSAAEGKMDMLSVLMHEYGHVLGLDHSTDSSDAMATVLQPGVRKLWSESDLAKLNEAIAASLPERDDQPIDRQSDGLPPTGQQRANTQLGRARRLPSAGAGIDPDANTGNAAQALYAINATLTNGAFQDGDGWETIGTVELANGSATLSESAHQQSQLSQGFVLTAEDRFLSFTVDGLQLTDSTNGPDDAFEVALLNANTRSAATAAVSLTRTDTLLNIQANGTERRITVEVDAVNNDTDGRLAGFVPALVSGPEHGTVVVNADGTFSLIRGFFRSIH